MDTELQFHKVESVLEVDGADGCTIVQFFFNRSLLEYSCFTILC